MRVTTKARWRSRMHGGSPSVATRKTRERIYTWQTYRLYVTTVSVRVDDAVLDEARKFGINVSEALRRGLADEVRKAKVADNVRRLAKHARKPSSSAVDQLRGLRDGRRP